MNTQETNSNFSNNMTVREFMNRNKKSDSSEKSFVSGIDTSTTIRIPVYKLKSTDMAQRAFRESHVKKIVDNFDKNKLQPIVVSLRDDVYYIVDGDHRTAAARVKFGKNYLMECKVVTGLTEQEEADLFVSLNEDRLPLTASDDARGKFYAGKKNIIDLYNICKKNHCIYDIKIHENTDDTDNSKMEGWRKIKCIKAMERTYEKLRYNYDDMFRVIKLLSTTWGDNNKDVFQEPMIKMMAVLVKTYGNEMSDRIFISRLSASPDTTPLMLINNANIDRISKKVKTEMKMARAAVYQYNTVRGKTKKLDVSKLGI